MTPIDIPTTTINEAVAQIREATGAKKCWTCGCFHSSLKAIEEAFQKDCSESLKNSIKAGNDTLQDVKYDCLGCEICYPANAINILKIEGDACPTEDVEERDGWPPLLGDYTVCRYQSPVAVCTLTDSELAHLIGVEQKMNVAVVGTLQTENLGIERVITNILANPNIRFLIVCGSDSRKTIGHLPGQSLIALMRNGINDRSRIVGAPGKRPLLRNLSREAVEYFRRTVEVIDLVDCSHIDTIQQSIRNCLRRNPGPTKPFAPENVVKSIEGYVPKRMVSDSSGYFVIYVDQQRKRLSLEHYQTNGVINAIIEGQTAAELYIPAIDKGLVSRLDHAAYLGKELARAEQSFLLNLPYVQDAAPEEDIAQNISTNCGCEPTFGGTSCSNDG